MLSNLTLDINKNEFTTMKQLKNYYYNDLIKNGLKTLKETDIYSYDILTSNLSDFQFFQHSDINLYLNQLVFIANIINKEYQNEMNKIFIQISKKYQ